MPPKIRVCLEPTLYPPDAVNQAIEAFRDHLPVRVDGSSLGWLVIETSETDSERLTDEFLNYALCASLEVLLQKF